MAVERKNLKGAVPRNVTFRSRLTRFFNRASIVEGIMTLLNGQKKKELRKSRSDYFRDAITGKILRAD